MIEIFPGAVSKMKQIVLLATANIWADRNSSLTCRKVAPKNSAELHLVHCKNLRIGDFSQSKTGIWIYSAPKATFAWCSVENKTHGNIGLKIYRKATESRGQQDEEVNERSGIYLRGQVTRKRGSAKHRSLPDEKMNLMDKRWRTWQPLDKVHARQPFLKPLLG